ncbi:DUF2861 family protein [Vibrio sp. SM6]|uniref:DUF2861 family protein n=1 Tax=Vibrio agarilyticus TaxID=2726741 RepID=A0A7X8YH92_9VIBR|nr:DUF2861 family protein [Vibrio agarilyticus]
MKTWVWLVAFVGLSAPLYAANEQWFEHNTALSQAHQHLLENDMPGMYQALIEVWQTAPNTITQNHLSELLAHSLTWDCGQSLAAKPLPDWISALKLTRQTIESPGRKTYRAIVDITSVEDVVDIELTRWPDKELSGEQPINLIDADGIQTEQNNSDNVTNFKERQHQKVYSLTSELEAGLYRLAATSHDGNNWSSWVILEESQPAMELRWTAQNSWQVQRTQLRNVKCPLPQLVVGLFDYQNGEYQQIWQASYESDYPTTFDPSSAIPDKRYILAVSLNTRRWQGDIVIEHRQTLSRNYERSQATTQE